MKILFVDDETDRFNQFVACNKNHDITHAKTCSDAIFHLEDTNYDIVCFDHDLGIDDTVIPAVKHIANNNNRFSGTTIIVHSANAFGAADIMNILKYSECNVNRIWWAWAINNLIDNIFD